MFVRLAFSLLALAAAAALTLPGGTEHVRADGETDPLFDADGDFLPDCIEWAMLTNAADPDTDHDNVSDFVEVVQGGNPRQAGAPLPTDQEMRVVITGAAGGATAPSWMHLLVRLTEPGAAMTSFQAWLELPAFPGIRLTFDMLALGPAQFQVRNAGLEGMWVQLSVPLVSTAVLQALLPCSIQAESVVAGRYLRSGVQLLDVQGSISSLVAFGDEHFALQSIASVATGGGLSNRVCLLDLQEAGSGPGGTAYIVQDAFCDDCNEVECAPNCTEAIGWVITVPGGLGTLGSND